MPTHKKKYPAPAIRLGTLLRRPYRRIRERFYEELARGGHPHITPAHSAVFRNVAPGGSRISDLAAEAGITKQSMGYLVDVLARRGYVELRPDPADGRAKLVFATKQGVTAVRHLSRQSRALEQRLRKAYGDAWVNDLRAKLERLDAFLEDTLRH
ncbi:MAG: MarR family transcriptional regulator [Opitutales bacterium]|nr:MarR family transcriptional regulator [Opitutales bacterium]